jgi:hypothetical protein
MINPFGNTYAGYSGFSGSNEKIKPVRAPVIQRQQTTGGNVGYGEDSYSSSNPRIQSGSTKNRYTSEYNDYKKQNSGQQTYFPHISTLI